MARHGRREPLVGSILELTAQYVFSGPLAKLAQVTEVKKLFMWGKVSAYSNIYVINLYQTRRNMGIVSDLSSQELVLA